jgi:cysteine desulfurase family protein
MIYFDCAATSLHRPDCVGQAMLEGLSTLGNPGRGSHPLALEGARKVYRCRCQLNELFSGDGADRVILTANATAALNLAVEGLFLAGTIQPGDHIITTCLEHNSMLRPLYRLEERGISLTILPCDEQGRIWPEQFEEAVRPNTRAIACTHASNVLGNVLDICAIGAIAQSHGLLFLVDGSQTAGLLEIDRKKAHISALSVPGHKGLLGPQGTGGLLLADGVQPSPLTVGGSGVQSFSRTHPTELPTALEAGTVNSHGIAGLSAALDWIGQQGRENLFRQADGLARKFYQGVRHLPGVTVYGDWESAIRAPIVSLNLEGEDAGWVSDILSREYGICTRPGAHCAPLVHQAMGTEEQGMVRFSFSHGNTEEEVETAIRAMEELTR